jgi:uncharacterized protein
MITVLTLSILLAIVAMLSSILGVLSGLGGGVLLIPFLILINIELHAAMAVSLISIMTLSLSTALTATGKQYTNLKMGIFLETGAVIGAIMGALLTSIIAKPALSILFGAMLIFAAFSSYRRMKIEKEEDPISKQILDSISFAKKKNLLQGWGLMGIAGALSGILGIGSGALKVLVMDQILNMPYRVSTATSNFMVGITVAASIGIYFAKGYVDLAIIFPVVSGSILGSFLGSKILAKARISSLRILFILVILLLAIEMFYKGVTGFV